MWRPFRYVGTSGIYTHTVAYEKDSECMVCSAGVPVHVDEHATLQQVSCGCVFLEIIDLNFALNLDVAKSLIS